MEQQAQVVKLVPNEVRQAQTFDPFKVQSKSSYDPEHVYTASTDGRGHYDKLMTKVPQGIAAQINFIVSERPEFRSQQDFVRNAIVHALVKWGELVQSEELQYGINLVIAADEMWRIEQEVDDHQAYFEQLSKALDKAIQMRDRELIVRAVDKAEGTIEGLREPYKGLVKAKVEQAKKELAR